MGVKRNFVVILSKNEVVMMKKIIARHDSINYRITNFNLFFNEKSIIICCCFFL